MIPQDCRYTRPSVDVTRWQMHASISRRRRRHVLTTPWATQTLDPGITPPEGDTTPDPVHTTGMVWDRTSKIRVMMTVTIEGEFHIISALRLHNPPQAQLVIISQIPAQTRGLLPKATIGSACVCATAPRISVQEAALLLIEACDM